MEAIECMLSRRSCRNYTNQPVEREKIMKILECANYAPSPANKQPWDFVVVTDPEYNKRLKGLAEPVKDKLAERSGWKWLPGFKLDFLTEAPVLIVVNGDPSNNGAEQFLDQPSKGYEQSCSIAVQNMMLAAQSMGLGSLWFSLFEKEDVRKLFDIPADKDPLAIVCIGYPAQEMKATSRKELATKVRFIE